MVHNQNDCLIQDQDQFLMRLYRIRVQQQLFHMELILHHDELVIVGIVRGEVEDMNDAMWERLPCLGLR